MTWQRPQLHPHSCGPACVESGLAYFGIDTGLTSYTFQVALVGGNTSAEQLAELASSTAEADVVSGAHCSLPADGNMVLIVLRELSATSLKTSDGHWVLIVRDGEGLMVFDPAAGTARATEEEGATLCAASNSVVVIRRPTPPAT